MNLHTKCQKGTVEFIDDAKYQFINTIDVNVKPEYLFDVLADPDSWLQWFPNMKSATWMDKAGVGSERAVKVGSIGIVEHFIHWEPHKRFSFYVKETTMPFAKIMVEDYIIEPTQNGSRFTYKVGMTPLWTISWAPFLAKPIFSKMFRDATKSLKSYIEN